MKDWIIIVRLGPSRLFVCRNCYREQAIQAVANEADFEYDEDMDNDYVEIAEIPVGADPLARQGVDILVEVAIDLE